MSTNNITPDNLPEVAPLKAEERPQSVVTIDQFHNIEMKVGTILKAEFIEGADKLLRLEVDFGPKEVEAAVAEGEAAAAPRDIRQILSGIREYYEPEQLIGKQCPFVTNLAPRTMRGLESHGMILAVGVENGIALLSPDKAVAPGSSLR
jgi:methionyl-tRNA synthetase